MLSNLYSFVVAGKQKAVVAFLITTTGTYAVKHGVNLDMSLRDALEAVLLGAAAHLGVYAKKNVS